MTRIAIVEDDFDLSQLVRDELRDAGHDVISYFKPSPDIVESFRSSHPDLILLDLRLNSYVTGWDIISAMKEDPDLNQIPIVVVTGNAEEVARRRSWLEGHNVNVLPKPFELEDLESIVNRTLVGR